MIPRLSSVYLFGPMSSNAIDVKWGVKADYSLPTGLSFGLQFDNSGQGQASVGFGLSTPTFVVGETVKLTVGENIKLTGAVRNDGLNFNPSTTIKYGPGFELLGIGAGVFYYNVPSSLEQGIQFKLGLISISGYYQPDTLPYSLSIFVPYPDLSNSTWQPKEPNIPYLNDAWKSFDNGYRLNPPNQNEQPPVFDKRYPPMGILDPNLANKVWDAHEQYIANSSLESPINPLPIEHNYDYLNNIAWPAFENGYRLSAPTAYEQAPQYNPAFPPYNKGP